MIEGLFVALNLREQKGIVFGVLSRSAPCQILAPASLRVAVPEGTHGRGCGYLISPRGSCQFGRCGHTRFRFVGFNLLLPSFVCCLGSTPRRCLLCGYASRLQQFLIVLSVAAQTKSVNSDELTNQETRII